MYRKAITVYMLMIILFIAFIVIFALSMVRMITAQSACLNKQQMCSSAIIEYCAAWYGKDKKFECPPPQPPQGKSKEDWKIGNCILEGGKTIDLDYCYRYVGKKPCEGYGSICGRPLKCESRDEIDDCYCEVNETFCSDLFLK